MSLLLALLGGSHSYYSNVVETVAAPTDAAARVVALARSIAESIGAPMDSVVGQQGVGGAVRIAYGPSGQALTITLAGLSPNTARSSLAIDNTTNLYLDALIQVQIKTGTSAIPAADVVNIYAYGSDDAGTTYPEGAGTDVVVTLTLPTQLTLVGQINAVANTTTYKSEPFSMAAAFGGALPAFWGIVVEFQTYPAGGGGALDATAGNFNVFYQGITRTVG